MNRVTIAMTVLMGLAVGLAGPARAETTLTFSHQFPKAGDDYRTRSVELFAGELKRAGAGLGVTIYPDQTLMRAREQWEALVRGTLNMSFFPLTDMPTGVPEVQVLGLPVLIKNRDHAARLGEAPAMNGIRAAAEAAGVVLIGDLWRPLSIGSAQGCIETPDDVAGLAIRAPSKPLEDLFTHVGAISVSMPSSEISKGLATGALDAVVTSAASLTKLVAEKALKCVTIPGDGVLAFLYSSYAMSKQTWDKLSPEQRAAVRAAADTALDDADREARKLETEMLDAAKAAGVEIRPLSAKNLAAWREVAEKTVWAQVAKSSPASARILEEFKKID